MLTVTVLIDAPTGAAQTAKEVLAMHMEVIGITKVVEIREETQEQMKIGGIRRGSAV